MTAESHPPLLFTPLPIGRGGLVLRNRIWLPAMVTWRGTEDGFVTPAVHDIYLRYALGGAGMIVLEATGVRDVRSGPLLRLSHDRFVPGLRALREEMREASDSLVIPQIIDFLKISTRKPTRAFIESMVKRGALPGATLDVSDAEFEASLGDVPSATRASGGTSATGTARPSRTSASEEIRQIPGFFAGAARRARDAGFDGVELHFAHAYTMASFLSVTNARSDAYGGSFENRMRLPREVIAAVRAEVGREFLLGCRYLGSEDILGEDGRILGNTLEDARRIGVELCRAGLDFLSISRGGKFEDALQPPGGRGRLSLHRPQRPGLHPAPEEGPCRSEHAPRHGDPRSGAGRGLRGAGGHGGQDPHLRAGRVHTPRGASRPGRHGSGPPRRPRPAAKVARGPRPRRAGLRLLPLLRGRGPAPPGGDLHPLAEAAATTGSA